MQYENLVRPNWEGKDYVLQPNPAMPMGCQVEKMEHPTRKSVKTLSIGLGNDIMENDI